MQYEIWECTNPDCAFRFPVGEDERARLNWKGICPRCHTAVRVCGIYDANGEETTVHAPSHGPARRAMPAFHALLDNLRSARNVGAIFRTADGVGIQHLYLCGITPAPEHPHAAAAALGAHKMLSYSRHANAFQVLSGLKNQGWILWALECGLEEGGAAAYSLEEAARSLEANSSLGEEKKLLLVVGNERFGVDPECLGLCAAAIWIPMFGKKGSFNAATAFGIAAYHLQMAHHSPFP